MKSIDEMTAEDFLAVLQKESERRKTLIEEDPDVYTTKEVGKGTGGTRMMYGLSLIDRL